MNVYIYQADLWCETCIKEIKKTLPFPEYGIPFEEDTYDSDDYPKGPYSDGGGESDCPQHCAGCSLFLENPLTSDGEAYVAELFGGFGDKLSETELEWAGFYTELQ